MIGLFDRDVFIKLGCCNLWSESLDALQISEPYRLVSTSSVQSNRRIIRRKMTDPEAEEALLRVMQMVQSVPVLPDAMVENLEGSPEFQQLDGCDGIDAGEQILASVLMRAQDEHVMISGDKKFIKAIREERPQVWESIEGRIISFERCLRAIVQQYGFHTVSERIYCARDCDGTLRLACGGAFHEMAFMEALNSFDPCP